MLIDWAIRKSAEPKNDWVFSRSEISFAEYYPAGGTLYVAFSYEGQSLRTAVCMTPGHYSRSLRGHRAAYLEFVVAQFGGRRVEAREIFLWRGPVLFLMIEENFGLYLMAALWRTLLGRRTVGLLFRPAPETNARYSRLCLKRVLLRGLRCLSDVRTLSIIPVPFNPKIGEVVDGWIHDFQLWDLSDAKRAWIARLHDATSSYDENSTATTAMLAEARRHAYGRPLLVALGAQTLGKGVERLAASLREGGTAGWAVLVAGSFASEAEEARSLIEAYGGRVIDRFLSDDEMLALYAAADAVWCLYDPTYDQASGILGRAVQLGIPPIVRRGSYSEALCKSEDIAHGVAEGGADVATALVALPPVELKIGAALSERFSRESIAVLHDALWVTRRPIR